MTIVIPSDNPDFLDKCVDAIFRNEPFVRKEDIIAVIDGDWTYDRTLTVTGLKPFCFARNVNHGMLAVRHSRTHTGQPDEHGMIVLNHDALLETWGGFSSLVESCLPEYGLVSSAIRGACCNEAQEPWLEWDLGGPADTDITVAFVCVYIPYRTIDLCGLLDKRLTGYGYDDDLYCTQVRAAGLKVGVWHGCVVEHGSLPSSFRSGPDCKEKMDYNHRLYHEIVREKGLEAHSTHHGWCKEFVNG